MGLSKHALRWPAFQRVAGRRKLLSRLRVRQDFVRLDLAGDAINGPVQTPIGVPEDPSGSVSGAAEGNGHVVYACDLDWRIGEARGPKALNRPGGETDNEAH